MGSPILTSFVFCAEGVLEEVHDQVPSDDQPGRPDDGREAIDTSSPINYTSLYTLL